MNYTCIPKEIWWDIFFYIFDTLDGEFKRNQCFNKIAGTSNFWKSITANNKTFLKKYFTKYFNSYSVTEKKHTKIKTTYLYEIERYAKLTDVLNEETHLIKTLCVEKERETDTLAKCIYDGNFNVRDNTIDIDIDLKSETDKLILQRDDLFNFIPKSDKKFPQYIQSERINKKEFSEQMRKLLIERRQNLFNEQSVSHDMFDYGTNGFHNLN